MKRHLILFIITLISTILINQCSLVNLQEEKLQDIDGNSYRIKKFNDQIWMTENLKTQKIKSGESIEFFIPNGDSSNIHNYGLLYDFETACKICPKGWHLPTDKEWNQLIEFFGKNSGHDLKDSLYWKNQDRRFTNKSGFSIRPSGYGNTEFENYFGTHAIFWSSTRVDSHFALGFVLADKSDSIRRASQHPTYAFSVRCIKDNKQK